MSTYEIGGYFELERFTGPMLHDGDIALNSGRACLEYLIELRGIERVWLPDYLCSSVPDACVKAGAEVKTYHVNEEFLPSWDFDFGDGDWLYLVDYFGMLRPEDVDLALEGSHGRLIIDEAQAYYRPSWEGADTLWTCRKWFGVADGAFLHTSDGQVLERTLPQSVSYNRMRPVLGRYEDGARRFFADSRENNAQFGSDPVSLMSSLTENLLRAINYEAVALSRRRNWGALDSHLGDVNLIEPTNSPEVPFMYPLLVRDARGARERLAEFGIFIPTLWPNVLRDDGAGPYAACFARDILPLPLDQRYGGDDMKKVVTAVKEVCGL